jgi:hypothetical protein
MSALAMTLLALPCLAQGPDRHCKLPCPPAEHEAIASYLYQPAYCVDKVLRGPAEPYLPQPGDIMLATDDNKFWKITHDMAFAFEPHNSAIVVARHDGSLGILEAGPKDTMRVRVLDMLPHLKEYADKGPVWIRKRRTPLTAEQCAALTDWAARQDGKLFALQRLGWQLLPFRTRGPLRTYVMGKPRGDIKTFFCSELVTESLVAGGMMDPRIARPSATYPHDLFFDQSYNLYINRHYRLCECWHPPARWTYCPEAEGAAVSRKD